MTKTIRGRKREIDREERVERRKGGRKRGNKEGGEKVRGRRR